MPKASEIDDIFAGKTAAGKPSKASAPATVGPSSDKAANVPNTDIAGGVKKKKKKVKTSFIGDTASEASKPAPADPIDDADAKPKKRPAETIVDPSLPKTAKKVKVFDDRALAKVAGVVKARAKRKVELDEEERAFRDSRGKEPRRKTEEGWNIYKEDELGMTKAGGDTPLCPFDCDCCF
ncbi:DUF1764-domain-containing protein [Calocera viscosa TUFC12733]|uniref:DUF1764-domain-containing protein n=1 Tax=Calocera viscosa (strain TUFC12733) TaxID=1330018 RepID=A0A167SCY1_CALVF|nr:DUF1764-domain-containing protein [Calocera viscosa TUFC12733]